MTKNAHDELNLFSQKRMVRFIEEFRLKSGQLPTLKDLAQAGFSNTLVDEAERKKVVEKFYVTLTNGTIVKAYKICGFN